MLSKTMLPLLLLLMIPSPLWSAGSLFGPPTSHSHANGAISVIMADFDGNNYNDMAVACESDNLVWVYYNTGNGTFLYAVAMTVGTQPSCICAADFNGDGHIDIAASTWYSGASVLINNGDSSFSVSNFPACNGPSAIVAADFNGDGTPDLAVTNGYVTASTDHMAVLINNGDGSFANPVKYDYGNSLVAIEAADLDGDGDQDLITANNLDHVIHVMKNTGSGTFAAPVDYATGYTPWEWPQSVRAGDLDGDGDQDLAVANMNDESVGIFINDGTGTFAAVINYPAGPSPMCVCAADLDNDGDLDLITADEDADSICVLRNYGDGTYSLPDMYPVMDGPRSLAAADLNNDGDIDLAVADYQDSTICYLQNRYFNDPPIFSFVDSLWFDNLKAMTTTVGEPLTFDVSATDPDGQIPVLTASQLPEGAGFADHGDGSGTFSWTPAEDQADVYAVILFAIDDMSAASQEFVVVTVNGDLSLFDPPVQYDGGGDPISIIAADLDNDGDEDLVAGNYEWGEISVMMNGGDATFLAPVSYTVGGNARSVVAADLDGDGDADLAVASSYPGDISILKNTGDGTFATAVSYTAGDSPYSVFAADLDGDGDNDLAVANGGSDDISILKNNGDGTFASAVNYGAGDVPFAIVACDLDGDNKPDLAIANEDADYVSILKNDGDGVFSPMAECTVANNPTSIVAADLDGDGDYDLAVGGSWYLPYVSILRNDGYGSFAPVVNYDSRDVNSLIAADLDNDGDQDIITANSSPAMIHYLMNNGDGFFGSPVEYDAGDNQPQSVAAADLDNDGDLDLAVARIKPGHAVDNTVSILINRLEILSDAGDEINHQSLPGHFMLAQNVPNPFNPVTAIAYSIARRNRVTLSIYDILGRKVTTIVNEEKQAGTYTAYWDGRDEHGNQVATGVYIYRLVTGESSESRKMLLLK